MCGVDRVKARGLPRREEELRRTSDLGAVLGVLVDAQLQVLAEGLVELGVVILVLCDLVEHLQALLHDVLADHLCRKSAVRPLTYL